MADRMFEFSSLLADLVEQAQIAGNVVEEAFIRGFFADMDLGEKEFRHIYAYLKASHIEIKGYEANEEVEKEVLDYKKAAKERLEAAGGKEEDGRDEEGEKKEPTSGFLKMYFEDLECVQKLSEEEEKALLEQIINENKEAEVEYTERKLHDVVEKARGFGLDEAYFEELIEEGNIGLLTAIKELKEKGEKENLKEFVDARIMSTMQDFLEESLNVESAANSMVAKVGFVSDAAKKLKEENGVSPTLMELAAYTNLTEEELSDIMDLSADNLKEK